MTRDERRPARRGWGAWRGWMLCGLGLALLGASGDPAETPPDPLPLAWCLDRATLASPDLDVARTSAEAAGQRVYPAGALPDPRFRYELSNVPTGDLDLDSTPLSGQQLGLSQQLPFPGLLGNRREAARSAADAAEAELGDESRRVDAATVRKAAGLRVRPIMMTVTSTIAGLLPIMWGSGTGSETMRRIAAPMVGGLVSATVLTLVVISVIFALVRARGLPAEPEGPSTAAPP